MTTTDNTAPAMQDQPDAIAEGIANLEHHDATPGDEMQLITDNTPPDSDLLEHLERMVNIATHPKATMKQVIQIAADARAAIAKATNPSA